jgi:16S rRNA (uracil1498-N3)-methyltransferase
MRSFFVEPNEIRKPVAVIAGSDARHIRKVLRLRPGARVRLTDGAGLAAHGRIQAVERDRVLVAIRATDVLDTAGRGEMVVAQAMLKDRKMDGLIRALTELGITTWLPFFAERSVAQPDGRRLQARCDRWARVAREAVKQCGRRRPPQIEVVDRLSAVVERADGFDRRIMFWEAAADLPASFRDPSASQSARVFLIIGPEGGFSRQEADLARRAGFQLAALGPRILRAETAALAAVSLAQYLYGDWQAGAPVNQDT